MRATPAIVATLFLAAGVGSMVFFLGKRAPRLAADVSHSELKGVLPSEPRAISSERKIAVWKDPITRDEEEITRLQNGFPAEERIRSSVEFGEEKLAEAFKRGGVSIEQFSDFSREEKLNVLRSERLQRELISMLQNAAGTRLLWDQVHAVSGPEKWLSPVYRRTVRDWVRMDPTAYLGGRIRFASKAEYLPYAGVDMAVMHLALADAAPLVEWAWSRRDTTPTTSCDILVQTLVVDGCKTGLGADGKFEGKTAAHLREMVSGKNPTYRLMALSLADSFESDVKRLVPTCERAANEVNQVFWKVALQKLETIGGEMAADAAKKFTVAGTVPSDGTAFADDADVAKEVEKLVSAVEARRSR